jgi:hypothetical protein
LHGLSEEEFMKLCLGIALVSLLLLSGGSFLLGPPYCSGVPAGFNAVAQLRTINTAEITFLSSENRYGTVEELVASGLLDPRFRTTVSDYKFAVTANGSGYKATAEPSTPNIGFCFYSGSDGVVRYGRLAPADLVGTPAF